MNEKISVLYVLYGKVDTKRLEISLASLLSQFHRNLEVILGEQSENPKLYEFARANGVKHCSCEPVRQGEIVMYSIGKIKNEAIKKAEGKYIYCVDTDILLHEQDFLKRLLEIVKENNRRFVIEPHMIRLPLEEFDRFYQKVNNIGIDATLDLLKFWKRYAITLNESSSTIIVNYKEKKAYTAFEEDYELMKMCPDKFKRFDPRIWSPLKHHGSVFTSKDLLLDVGGYHKGYYNWGYEDVDLKWKLSEVGEEYDLFLNTNISLIHLDHSRDYFDEETGQKNKNLFQERVIRGVKKAIEHDKENFGEK